MLANGEFSFLIRFLCTFRFFLLLRLGSQRFFFVLLAVNRHWIFTFNPYFDFAVLPIDTFTPYKFNRRNQGREDKNKKKNKRDEKMAYEECVYFYSYVFSFFLL